MARPNLSPTARALGFALMLSALLVSSGPAAWSQADTQVEQDFAFAEGLYGQENYELALQKYLALIQAYPNHPNMSLALFRAGECNFRLGHYAEAAPLFVQVTERFADSPEAELSWLWLGDAHFKAGGYEEAAAAYGSLLTKFPNGTHAGDAAYWRAESYYQLGRYEEAAAAYQDALGRGLQDNVAPYAIYSTGLAYLQLDRPAEAAEQFTRVVRDHATSPVAAESAYFLGRAHQSRGQFQEAIADYQAVLEKHPNSPYAASAQFGIASCHFQEGRYEPARAAWASVVEHYPNSPAAAEAALRIGDSFFHLERWPEAAAAYQAVAQVADSRWAPDALYWLGVTQEKQGDTAGALASFRALIDAHADSPRVGDAWLHTAQLEAAQGNHDAAMTAYEAAMGAVGDTETRRQALAALQWARYENDRSPEALADLEAIVREDPASDVAAELAYRVGRAHFDAGSHEAAKGMLTLLLASHPDSAHAAEATYLLGMCEENLGDPAAAEAHYRALVDAEGTSEYAGYAAAALAAMQAARGETAQALQLVARLERDRAPGPTLAFACYRVAEALRDQDQPAEALPLYEKALAADPEGETAPYAWVGVGWCRVEGDARQALAAWRTVLTKFPDSPAAPLALEGMVAAGAKLFDAEDYAGAEALYREIVDGHPDAEVAVAAQYGLAWALLRQEKADEALPLFAAVATASPDADVAADARYRAARVHVERDENQQAVALLEPLRAQPGEGDRGAWALELLGRALLDLQRPEEAAQVFAQVAQSWPEHEVAPAAQLGLGRSYRALGRYAEAETALRQAMAGAGQVAVEAHYELAATMRDRGDVAGAAEEFLKVAILYQAPEWSAMAQYAAGQCYEQLGQTDNAVKSYRVIVNDYADQAQWVAQAQERLQALQ